MKGPVPGGQSARDEDARTARHAAKKELQGLELQGLEEWDEEPGWLDEAAPVDPDGDERDWPGDFAQVAAQAQADGAVEAAARQRLLAAGTEIGYAHYPGGPAIPGVKSGPGGGFGQSQPLDQAAPEWWLAERADYAAGTARLFGQVDDDELFGLLGARRKLSSRQAWELLMTIAEVIRRRPAPGCRLRGAALMPRVWAEGTAGELTVQLGITRSDADGLLSLAWDLAVKLPLTSENLRDGVIDLDKARIASGQTRNLTAEEAGQVERILFAHPDVVTMTKTMIRDRIKRAVIEVNPDAARKHREAKAKERRIEIGQEDSGNAMIAGRELPCQAVLAIDQKIRARALQLRKLGVNGGMDELRVLAFLERWGEADPVGDVNRGRQQQRQGAAGGNGDAGGKPEPDGAGSDADSRDTAGEHEHDTDSDNRNPGQDDDQDTDRGDGQDGDPGTGNGGGSGPRPGGNGGTGGGGCSCGGAAGGDLGLRGWMHLTGPAATLTGHAERPGTMTGIGPIDPALLRDLAAKMATNPATTYCYTATDPDGRPVAHACGKPGPDDRHQPGKPDPLGTGGGPDPPATLTLIERGPPGSLGTWRYTTGNREILFEFEDIAGPCDHRHQASGHEPGRRLRHLTGILNQTCTQPTCRRPEKQCDNEHSKPYDNGGITCLCTCGPVCRRHHRDKQQPGWKLEEAGSRGWFKWTTPSGRTHITGPTIYPI